MQFLRLLLVVPFVSLTACGGGGGGGGGAGQSTPSPSDPPLNHPLTSYDMLLSETNVFLAAHNIENGFAGNLTIPKNMPQSGTGTYTGASVLSVGDCTKEGGPHLAGKTRLTADFAKQTLSGTVSEFSAVANHKTKGGKLNISGRISSTKVTGKLAGSIGFDDKNYAIDAPLEGVFLKRADTIVLNSSGKTKAGESFSATITGSQPGLSK